MTPGFEEFERRGLETMLEMVVRARIALLFVVAGMAAWVGWVDPATWRRILLVVLVLALTVLDVQTRRRFTKHGFEPASVQVNLAGMIVIQATLIFVTGGLASPLIPVMLPPAFAAGLHGGGRGVRALVLPIQVPAVVAYLALELSGAMPSLIPEPFASGTPPTPEKMIVMAVVMSLMLVVFGALGARVRFVAQQHLERVADAQDAALASHRQRVDELTTLSGEIAHELKNPLASVKGLSQLLARNAAGGDPKTVERLEVLQREVERMQATLDEFLNYSRPLTPLNRADVSVKDLCHHVATLHEAMAAERGVHVDVNVPGDLRLQGDPRKIGQVLINLLQNALEASPSGTRVELRGRRNGERIVLEVRDRGTGLAPEVTSTLFDPGVTTKPSGHGLGLTVARAIAEQHGGELRVDNADGGGCRVQLSLPPRGGIEVS